LIECDISQNNHIPERYPALKLLCNSVCGPLKKSLETAGLESRTPRERMTYSPWLRPTELYLYSCQQSETFYTKWRLRSALVNWQREQLAMLCASIDKPMKPNLQAQAVE